MSVKVNPESGLVEGVLCSKCGSPLLRNAYELYRCTNRDCQWRSYTLSPPPRPERKEGRHPIATSGSRSQYIEILGAVLNKSGRQIYRLRKQLGDIQIKQVNSHCTSLVLYPGGGNQRIPLPLDTKSYRLVRPPRGIREGGGNLKLTNCYLLLDVAPKLSGKPLIVEGYRSIIRAGPRANA